MNPALKRSACGREAKTGPTFPWRLLHPNKKSYFLSWLLRNDTEIHGTEPKEDSEMEEFLTTPNAGGA